MLILSLATVVHGQLYTGVVAPSRAIDWSTAGVPGGIPSGSWTQSGGTIAAGASAATIQTALNACGTNHFVHLGTGTFSLNNGLTVPSNCELRGDGANLTTLNFTNDGGYYWGQYFIGFIGTYATASDNGSAPGFGGCAGACTKVTWTGTGTLGNTTFTKGDTVLNLGASATGLSAGMMLQAVQNDNAAPGSGATPGALTCAAGTCSREGSGNTGRGTGERQNFKVVSISGTGANTQVTVTPPVMFDDWSAGRSPIVYYQACCDIRNSGVAALTVDGRGFHTQVSEPISFFMATDSWVNGVAVRPFNNGVGSGTGDRSGITLRLTRGITVQHSWVDTAFGGGNSSTTSYGIELVGSTSFLIVNDIFKDVESPILYSAGSAGGVVVYDYIPACSGAICTTGETGILHHEEGDMYGLWEGNETSKLRSDNVHGTELHKTIFRNYTTGSGEAAIDLDSFNRYQNIVGNVLVPGTSVSCPSGPCNYTCIGSNTSGTCDRFSPNVYRIGKCGPDAAGTNCVTTFLDTVADTLLSRYGNYDSKTGAVRWCGNSSNTGWSTTCGSTSEVPTGISPYAQSVPTLGDVTAGQGALPPSLVFSVRPPWWGAKPWPLNGPDVTGGNIAGTAGHANTTLAHDCFTSVSGNVANFNAATCYTTSSAPGVSFSPTSLTFSNQAVGTSSSSQPVVLTNNGSATLTISSIATTGDFSQTNTCAGTLAPALSCTISVTFTPTLNGVRSGSVVVTDDASGSPQTVSLTGTGFTPTPIVSFSPTSLSFANQIVGTSSASQPITLTNTGNSSLTVTSLTASGDFSQTNNCGASLAASASCTINVTFTPTVQGARVGSITLVDNAAGSPHTVGLTGTGVAPGVTFNPSSLTFPSQAIGVPSTPQSMTLTNSGNAVLNITSITATGDFSRTTTCGATLAIGANCTVTVTFTPTVAGTRNGTITVVDNAPGTPHIASLIGGGFTAGLVISGNLTVAGSITFSVAPVSVAPVMGIAPPSLAFGSVTIGNLSTMGLTISNTGTAPLNITSIVLANTSAYSQTNNCTVVPPGTNCVINVTFSPLSTGAINTTITIFADDAASPHIVNITGTGVAVGVDLPLPNFSPALTLPQSQPDPGVPGTQTTQQTIYIGNSTCPTAPARTNYLGQAKSATVCDYADAIGTGLQTTTNDWCAAADQRWDVIITHGTSFNFGGVAWVWCTKPGATKFLSFHSDTPNPRGRQVCSHGMQDVVSPPLPDMGQRNHRCIGFLGAPDVSVPMPITDAAYTFDASYNDLANMYTLTSTATGVGTVIQLGGASFAGAVFNDCGGPCPVDGVNHIVLEDSRTLPASSVTSSITVVALYPLEWQVGTTSLSAHWIGAACHDIGIDHNYFTADADDDGFGTNAITDEVKFACANSWFTHNYADGVKRDGSEDHVLNLTDMVGPALISHNWCEGGAICFWQGGAVPAVVNLLSSSEQFTRNKLTYNLRWAPGPAGLKAFNKAISASNCASNVLTLTVNNSGTSVLTNLVVYVRGVTGVGVSNAWYTASSITATTVTIPVTCTNGAGGGGSAKVYGYGSNVNITSAAAMNGRASPDPVDQAPIQKNRWELKEGQFFVADGNICENSVADGQSGVCQLFSVRAGYGGVTWGIGGETNAVTDVVYTNNIIRHSNQPINSSPRSGASSIKNWTITNVACASDGNSAAITANSGGTNITQQLSNGWGGQTTYGSDVYLADIGGAPLLAEGWYATAYPTSGNYSNDSIVTVIGTGICAPSATTTTGTVYGAFTNDGSGVSKPGRRYVIQNTLIYDIGDHTKYNGAGSVSLLAFGGGENNYSVALAVTQVSPTLQVTATSLAINSCPANQQCPKVFQTSVGDFANVQCPNDIRFSSGPPSSKGVPIISVAGDQLSFIYTPQNGSPALTLTDTATCAIEAPNTSVQSGFTNGQGYVWPFYWNHNTAVGVNSMAATGNDQYARQTTWTNSIGAIPGTGDVTLVNLTATSGGFKCSSTDKYSVTDTTGVTNCTDRAGLVFGNNAFSNRSITNYPTFPGAIANSNPSVNPATNTTPARVSTPGASVTCGGVACDATHFIPDSVGFLGAMNTSNYPMNLPDFRNYELHPSSPYNAGGILQGSDGRDLGVQMSILLNAQNRTLYVCGLPCGTGPHRDGPQYGWLVWSASSDPTLVNYRVYRDGAGSPTATVTPAYFTDYGLPTGAHSWVVKAWNGTTETPVTGLTTTTY